MLPFLSLSLQAADAPGFPQGTTCKAAITAELARGSVLQSKPEPKEPAMKSFYGTQVFQTRINGSAANIIYMCSGTKDSGGKVNAQLIYINFESEADAQAEYLWQRERLGEQLGKPCWDPNRYQVDGLGPEVVWNARAGSETSLPGVRS